MAYTTIDDPSAYFQVHYWVGTSTGDGVAQTFGGNSDLQPDFIWHKHNGSSDHGLFTSSLIANDDGDTTRTIPVSNRSEVPYNNNGGVDFSSFDSDGFTLDSSSQIDTATNNGVFTVNWCWKANGGTTATNGDGNSANDSVTQVNSTSKFSIVKFENGDEGNGTTFGHGLGVKPGFSLIKNRDVDQSWYAHWPSTQGANQSTALDGTAAVQTVSGFAGFNTSTITQGQGDDDNYICFLWANVQGFSKFGLYTGNGLANGPVVNLGFKPAFIIIKKTSGIGQWLMYDNKRNEHNPTTSWFAAESSAAQTADSNKDIDLLSMGFKAKDTGGDLNDNGGTYAYAAWAQSPVVTSTGVPATAV